MFTQIALKKSNKLAAVLVFGFLCVGCRESTEEKRTEVDVPDLESPLNSLEVMTVESDMWFVLFKSVLGERYQFDLLYRPYESRPQTNRIPASEAISKGDIFFKEDPGKGRFKLIDIEDRNQEGSNGSRPGKCAIVEDQSAHKKGRRYELRFNSPAYELQPSTQYDHTVVFNFNSGEEDENQFRVEENEAFSLPPGGEEKPYKVIEVKLEDPGPPVRKAIAVVIQYEAGGETKTREILVPKAE